MVCRTLHHKGAFLTARTKSGGIHLGLKGLGLKLWWQFKGGMVWEDLLPKVKYLMQFNDLPVYLKLHCGANDVGNVEKVYDTKTFNLIQDMILVLDKIRCLIPEVKIVWSQLLERNGGILKMLMP